MVLLFSSDYYPVYKRDIFAVTSLPKGYCYHFRYQEKYVSPKIRDGSFDAVNREAMIVFVAGNKKGNTNISFIAIRLAKIIKVSHETQTNLYHVYFELGDFIELLDDVNSFDEKPQDIYFGQHVVQPKYRKISWVETVTKLKPHGNGFFFNVRIEDKDQGELAPKRDPGTFEPYFQLTEANNYLIKISMADFNQNKEENEIVTKIEGTDIKSNIGESINSGLDIDDRCYKLDGLILGDLHSSVNLLKISTKSSIQGGADHDYTVKLLFNVGKDSGRFWTYFFFSVMVFLGGGLLATDLTKIISQINCGLHITLKIVGLLLASVAAASLFFRFNKK